MHHFLPNGQSLVIRLPELDEAAALMHCLQQMTRESDFLLHTPEEALGMDIPGERAFIKSFRDQPNHLLLVAVVDGFIVGYLTVTQGRFYKQAHTGEMGIAILRNYWNLGIGRRLMTAMVRWAEDHPLLELIYFQVFAHNEKAIQLYRNFDFQECGRLPGGIRQKDGRRIDLVTMCRRVKQLS
ncbi:hypothetical protein DCC81_05530 [Chitinophaga parva]|uniref:N-acetyltransferase domain-containing protein n=1 Tax=Chitinophaga parva TaxID=2169414 RepID=A0A2T7BMN0_9BACT|nr:GNAT family N-acetyltransferase [Chitinophaga parva]PUZ28935.1 hypothetical protein DCC81_05530 [Chitinophaga parva]